MLAPGQRAQHGQRIIAVGRLAEDAAIEDHRGIGTKHADVRPLGKHSQPGERLVACQTLDIGERQLAGQRGFVDIRGDAVERQTDLRQQLTAARRTGCQIKLRHHDSQSGSARARRLEDDRPNRAVS
ncbi:hypothetical protein D9M69_700250 [compost metagenome]